MIISDGTTDVTFTGTQFDDFTDIEQSSLRTAKGETRTVRAGNRLIVSEKVRITGSEWATIRDLLLNGSDNYYYTPTTANIPDYLTSADFPMRVSIDKPKKSRQAGGGDKKYHVSFKILGSRYL